jgi:type II secretory pathway pseudopilin PulG
LLELLIVLAIAGALAALVPPMVSAVVPGTKARVAALDLASTLRDARNLAITSSRTIDVEFDFERSTYTVAGAAVNDLPRGMAVAMLDFSVLRRRQFEWYTRASRQRIPRLHRRCGLAARPRDDRGGGTPCWLGAAAGGIR